MNTRKRRVIGAFLMAAVISCGLFYQEAQAANVTGDITFAGTVQLNAASVDDATEVTAWNGVDSMHPEPQVQGEDGTFATFVTTGDQVHFTAPWTFNSGTVAMRMPGPALADLWDVDGFTFNLTSSSVTFQGTGDLSVEGVGTVSGHGFGPTPGTFNFSTQDPGAGTPAEFSFSAATGAVPEPGTIISFLSGSSMLGALLFIRRRRT